MSTNYDTSNLFSVTREGSLKELSREIKIPESPMMDGKFRPRVHVFGPFEQMVRLSGCDLQESIFSWAESRKRGATGRAVISTLLFVLVLVVFFAKFFYIMSNDAKAFTVIWAESNMETGVFLFAIAAAICLGIWTHAQYFRVFHEKLDALEEGPVRSEESFSRTHIKAFIFSIICLTGILAHSGRDFIWVREVNGTVGELQLNFGNFWGAEPLVRGLVGELIG
ncbi:unnamed protein product, partial [Mesorhabditis belari]|uniref:Uncharacterized protein n=1 Tax=Mesorhabditis belari TaxID=2138241 RepID=A0AAF3J8B1_9BILA